METKPCKRCLGTGKIPTANGMRKAREQAGILQREMAKMVGVSVAFISYIENGKSPPPDYVVAAYNELTK